MIYPDSIDDIDIETFLMIEKIWRYSGFMQFSKAMSSTYEYTLNEKRRELKIPDPISLFCHKK